MPPIQKATSKFLKIDFKSDTIFTILLVVTFLCVGLIGIIHHEMWRDELHAWMIARDSSSLVELFKNLRYEGHPALWHICLYFLSRFTRSPLVMQLFHLAIAAIFVYLFAKYSPFTRLQKILFTFGYFPLYEYGIISRNYNIGVLLIFLFCIFFPNRYKGYSVLSIILALLANTNAFTFIVAVCLAMILVFERVIDKSLNYLFHNPRWDLVVSATIFIAGALIALMQLIPPTDSKFTGDAQQIFQPSGEVLINKGRLASISVKIWRVYVPIPIIYKYNFWNSNILMEDFKFWKIAALLSLVLLFISISLFIKKPVVLLTYLSVTGGTLLFHYVKFIGALRHSGYLFIILLACLWLFKYYEPTSFSLSRGLEKIIAFFSQHKNQYLNTLLCIHVIVAIYAFSMDLKYPFSASKEVAEFIENQHLKNTLIVGSRDTPASSIAALLDKKIYYPESQQFGTFIKYNNPRKSVSTKEILDQINNLITPQNEKILLILNNQKKFENDDIGSLELSISKLFSSNQGMIGDDETYHLYLVQRKPSRGG